MKKWHKFALGLAVVLFFISIIVIGNDSTTRKSNTVQGNATLVEGKTAETTPETTTTRPATRTTSRTAKSTTTTTVQRDIWKDLEKEYPLITLADVNSGKYDGQDARIHFIIKNLEVYSDLMSGWRHADVISESGDYKNIIITDLALEGQTVINNIDQVKAGDIIECFVTVSEKGYKNVATHNFRVIDNIHSQAFITYIDESLSNCEQLSYDAISREPDKYLRADYQITGTVFQLIEEEPYYSEFLLKTEDGLVYAVWGVDQEDRGPRILKGDVITLYGKFMGLEDYPTLVGNNIVPRISVFQIDRE